MAFHFVIHARAASCKDKKNALTSIFMKSKQKITYPSEVLVASNARLSRTPCWTNFMLEKAPLNFPVYMYALRDIETAVREGFRVGQKMSFC